MHEKHPRGASPEASSAESVRASRRKEKGERSAPEAARQQAGGPLRKAESAEPSLEPEREKPAPSAGDDTLSDRREDSRHGGLQKLVPWLAGIAALLICAAVAAGILFSGGEKPEDNSPVVLSGTDIRLTNNQFAYFYWSNYVYLSAQEVPPFDTGMALGAQWYDENTTWQQHLLELAMDNARQTMVFVSAARASGFTLPPEAAADLETQKAAFRQKAVDSGYGGRMQDFLVSLYGPGANEETFAAYLEDSFLATAYSEALFSAPTFSDQELSDYYDAHADVYSDVHLVRKDDTRAVDLRCIFLVGEDSSQRASQLQAAFLEDPTEECFAALAAQYNEDESADEDGVYRDVVPARMEESLRDWCFAAARQVGDEAVVAIDGGHVLVYLSAKSDVPLWKAVCESDLRYETYQLTYDALESAANLTAFPELADLPVPESLIPQGK